MDRNAGIEYFDSPRDNKEIYEAYVIDCVPERQDLGCLQLITSTSNLEEVRDLLDSALDQMGLSRGWSRIVLEKPFGHDLESARQLNRTVLRTFDESNIYRIDHYLGKETVQNILVFRRWLNFRASPHHEFSA